MDQFTMDSFIMAIKLFSEWGYIKTVLFIMDNGKIMQEMDGEFTRIKITGIDMLDSGSKIGEMDLVDRAR